jgi:hypothetical protein
MQGRKRPLLSRSILALAVAGATAASLAAVGPGASAQVGAGSSPKTHLRAMTAVRPLADPSSLDRKLQAGTPKLKTWKSKISVDGQTFAYRMVGKNVKKALTKPSTTVKVPVIPLIIKIGASTFDPTVVNNGCETKSAQTVFQQSPIFDKTTTFNMNGVSEGPTQYVDAFQRANFFQFTKPGGVNPGYHVRLKYLAKPAVTVDATGHAAVEGGSGCSLLGGVEINWFDNLVQGTLFPQIETNDGVTPAQFPLFLTRSVVWYINTPGNCCVLGYHGAFSNPRFSGSLQTYSPTDLDLSGLFGAGIKDTSIAAHEVGEWMDDPTGGNPTPAWGNIGQVSGCQGNLEVGDPLTGTNVPNVVVNGQTYHLQELAFFSWFYHQSPSWGAGGKYSNNGTFTTFADNCP